jgi:hypothetical protein
MECVGQKPTILYKRFRKEIKRIPPEYNILGHRVCVMKPNIHDFLLNYDLKHNYKPKHQLLCLSLPISFHFVDIDKFINIKISGMSSYPFSPPKIIFKNKDILCCYKSNLFIKYKKYLKKTKSCCLVCSSVLSASNWTCITSFTGVFYEMISNIINVKRAIEMLHMEKVIFKYVGDEYLLKYILNYL